MSPPSGELLWQKSEKECFKETIPNSSGWRCQGEAGSKEIGEDQILPTFLNLLFMSLRKEALTERSESFSSGIPMAKKISVLIRNFSAAEIALINSSLA